MVGKGKAAKPAPGLSGGGREAELASRARRLALQTSAGEAFGVGGGGGGGIFSVGEAGYPQGPASSWPEQVGPLPLGSNRQLRVGWQVS